MKVFKLRTMVVVSILLVLVLNLSTNLNAKEKNISSSTQNDYEVELVYESSGKVKEEIYSLDKVRVYKYIFEYNDDNTLKMAERYDFNAKKITYQYYYLKNTVYGNHGKSINYSYVFKYKSDNTIYNVQKYDFIKKEYTAQYYYNEGTMYGNHGIKLKYGYFFKYKADNTLYMSEEYNYSKKSYTAQYYYKDKTYYGSHGNRMLYAYYFIYKADKTLNFSEEYNYDKKQVTAQYIYNTGTKYGEHGDKIAFVNYFKYNANGTLNHAIRYDYKLKKNITKYIYMDNTYYGKDHGKRIKQTIDLTKPADVWTNPTNGGYATTYTGHVNNAIDIGSASVKNYDIKAARAGTVETAISGYVGSNKAWGYANQIVINHGNGLKTRYAHLETLKVKKGDKVYAGQVIAKMGYTGWVEPSGPKGRHLHFEVFKIVNGKEKGLNPLNYVNYQLRSYSNYKAFMKQELNMEIEDFSENYAPMY